MGISRYIYLGIGWFCVGLGVVGIILPVLPTTPFLLVAVWAFSRSSPALAAKIRNHKTFGPLVRHWQDHGVIPLKAKLLAVLMMTGTSVYLLWFSNAPLWLSIVMNIVMAVVAVFVLTRPSTPPQT